MKIYVIRHGQTKLNVQGRINGSLDDELTDKGKEQAAAAAQKLPKTIKRMYVSSLWRAKQSAEILNADLQLPVIYSDDLQEVNFGKLNGQPYLEVYGAKHATLSYDWRPSGENFNDVKTRILRILRKIYDENGDGEALIVGHGGTIRTLHYLESGDVLGEVENAALFDFDLDKILSRA